MRWRRASRAAPLVALCAAIPGACSGERDIALGDDRPDAELVWRSCADRSGLDCAVLRVPSGAPIDTGAAR